MGYVEDRFRAQLLTGTPARDPVAVVDRLLAVQAQDPRGMRLAIRARTTGLSVADVDRALSRDRSLVVTWLNRGTLHLVRADDYWWLHALTTPQLQTSVARRLSQEGVSPTDADRAVAVISRAVRAHGPQTRGQLRTGIAARGIRVEGQALVHLLFLASLRGRIVRGPMIEREHAFVDPVDWLDRAPTIDRDQALRELARRYLIGHGPASADDLARWAGVTLGAARRGMSAVAPLLRDAGEGRVVLADRERASGLPGPMLLGAFDPLLLGWRARDFVTGDHRRLITVNGLFRPFALVGGRAAATWTIEGGEVRLRPFGRLGAAETAALDADAADVRRFLGMG